jgi:predicted nucleic acid-binding protein
LIFVDTSAFYALADRSDPNHQQAAAAFRQLLEEREPVLTHSYVLLETTALVQRRLGLEPALRFLRESEAFQVHWITFNDHREASVLLAARGRRALSLADCASFVVMRRYGVSSALVFDADFGTEGFVSYRNPVQ